MRYYFGALAIIVLLFFGVKAIFTGTKKKTPASTSTTSVTSTTAISRLSDYSSTDAEVSITTEGAVVGDEEHNAIRITVSRDERTLDIINGYNGLVTTTQSFDNNQAAYTIFLHALENYNFTREIKPKVTDDRGVCPAGSKYIYELKNTGKDDTDKRLWSVSCGAAIGNFGGIGPSIRDLFQKQIPDYSTLVSKVRLSGTQ